MILTDTAIDALQPGQDPGADWSASRDEPTMDDLWDLRMTERLP